MVRKLTSFDFKNGRGMKTRTRDCKSLYFKLKFEEGCWRVYNPDEENETEIVAELHEESDFQIEK